MIAGKVVAITGASSGIGKAAALRLAHDGARVVLGAQGENGLRTLAEQIGEAAIWRPTDVTRQADLAALVALALERFGRLDVLVSNAGVMPIGPLDELAVADWERMVDVNIKGVLWGIAAALPVFRRQRSGHFIHIGSTAARKTVGNQAVYSGTKAAVLAISEGLRQEVAGELRVTVVTPGMTDTRFAAQVTNTRIRDEMEAARGTIAMPPDAVAQAIAFAIGQPDAIDVGEIIIRSTAQT